MRGCFNPRPAPKCRATLYAYARSIPTARFNPRPAPKCRATDPARKVWEVMIVSIRARHLNAERLVAGWLIRIAHRVSIRARHLDAERLRRRAHGGRIRLFQSAPGT